MDSDLWLFAAFALGFLLMVAVALAPIAALLWVLLAVIGGPFGLVIGGIIFLWRAVIRWQEDCEERRRIAWSKMTLAERAAIEAGRKGRDPWPVKADKV
jgi:cadmium resistance protein CadD (predicted permease)